MATGLQWIREDTPRWDADKQRLFGPAELAATALTPPGPGAPVADAWWHVTDAAGAVVGYGWLDSEWGDAEVTFVVDPARRGERIGEFIVDHLEAEAAARGVNYIYNVVPATNPDPEWVRAWLLERGFVPGDGDLRRRVGEHAAS
jgi:GNAT superfamily N-acetyltransferase